MKKFFKKVVEWLTLIMTGKNEEAVYAGICDYSGEGRDKYGK